MLLFENVRDLEFPVITNAFGSLKRICLALGVENLGELGVRIDDLMSIEALKSLMDAQCGHSPAWTV